MSLANVDHLLARACKDPQLQAELAAAHSLDDVIAVAAQRGLTLTADDLTTSCGTGSRTGSGVVWLISSPGFDWLSHLIQLSRHENRAA